jgi:flagellar biosynthesis/type III secretory pathway protein FliH
MDKIIGGIAVLLIILGISQCGTCSAPGNSSSSSGYNSGYEAGYNKAKKEFQNSGYEAGYNKAKNEFQNSGYDAGYNTAAREYQLKIAGLEKSYEIKIQDAYREGFSDGEIAMRNRITAEIELNAKNKARQGDWNAILFDPKN